MRVRIRIAESVFLPPRHIEMRRINSLAWCIPFSDTSCAPRIWRAIFASPSLPAADLLLIFVLRDTDESKTEYRAHDMFVSDALTLTTLSRPSKGKM